MAKELIMEIYCNACRPLTRDTTAEPELTSWVSEKHIQFDWKTMNRLLKMKFKEPNFQYLL